MKPLLDKDGLDRRPHNLGIGRWYYEEKQGIKIYCSNGFEFVIPWRQLRPSVHRYEKGLPKARRR
jgi:hypothetical protein